MSTLTTFPPAYLYIQYGEDENLQALIKALNDYAQSYLDQLNGLNLPIYTKAPVAGALLDWMAEGLYGIRRPSFRYVTLIGGGGSAYNEDAYNEESFGGSMSTDVSLGPVSDDVFRRILTWQLFKGDGKQFNVRWLKRRIMRFLFGVDGIDPPVDQTYPVKILYSYGGVITIRFPTGEGVVTGGTICNTFVCNTMACNDETSIYTPVSQSVDAGILKQAIDAGILPLPFQYTFYVQLS